jgi:hypothetical protein
MEIKVIKLNHSDFLELSIGNNQWTHISLVTATSKTLLGADVYSVICTKLKTALKPYEATNLIGEINGISVVNILNLSENHYSLYLGKATENCPILFFQNSDGILVNSLDLDVKMLERELNCLVPGNEYSGDGGLQEVIFPKGF